MAAGVFAMATQSVCAVEWTLSVEKGGATNVVTAANCPFAIDVSFSELDGAWSGRIVNHEKGAVVVGFEVTADPLDVVPGKSALYIPHVYGRRIRNWPEHSVKQSGTQMWRETAKGVFVPWMSPWDVSTGSRAAPLPFPSKLATMQWMTVNDGENGFYAASEDPLAGAKDLQIEYDSNTKRIKLGFFFPMHLPDGCTYEVPRIVMKEYAGSWHEAAKTYRKWWNTCRKVVSVPKSVRDSFTGFMMVILKQQNGEIMWPYTEFDSLGDAALTHGFRHVEFHGWGVGGHDNFYPEFDPDPAMGGRAALVEGIKRLQDRGLHVSVYSNGQLQQQGGTKWYEEKGFKCPIVKRDGSPMSEYWVKFKDHPGVTFDVACPSSPEWRAQMLKICRDAKSLGFQGFFYDQIGKQWPGACFDSRHGHRPGEFVYTRDRETMLLNVIDSMHRDDPGFVLWSESFNDTILDSVALYQGLFYVTEEGYNAANRFVDGNSCDMYPEMTFYTFPELIMCDRNSTSLCTRKRANACAVTNLRVDFEVRYRADRAYVERGEEPPDGYYGKIVSKPAEIGLMKSDTWRTNRDYLKCVSDFRRKNAATLLAGTFKADEGFSVAGGEKLLANRWDGANGETGILVWNADDTPAKCTLSFAGKFVSASEPERGEVDADEPIPANTLRLYKYRYVQLKPQDVRARAVAALRRNCLDTFLGIAREYGVAKANGCGWLYGYGNWNAACCEYMAVSAIHVLDDPQERAEAIELAERSTKSYLAGFTEDGLCLEGQSYWSYGFGQYMRLALWTRRATGSFLSFITPFAKKAYLSSFESMYRDKCGPSFGDSNIGDFSATQRLGEFIWPEYRGPVRAIAFSGGIADATLRAGEQQIQVSVHEKPHTPFVYPLRSWYPEEIGQLVCRPNPADAGDKGLYAAIQGGHNDRPHGHHDIGSYCIAVGGIEVMGDPDHCYYRVYENGSQIASTVATSLPVKTDDVSSFTVKNVDKWGNEGR